MIDYEKLAIASPSERVKMVKKHIYDAYQNKVIKIKGIKVIDEYFAGSKHLQLDMDSMLILLLDKDDKKLLEANK